MGLARFGIANGIKVPVEGLVAPSLRSSTLDKFSSKALSQFGFLRIAQKIIAGDELLLKEINSLISDAGFPVLMKLIGLSKRTKESLSASPAVLLPLRNWMNFGVSISDILEQATDFLCSIPHCNIQVAFDDTPLDELLSVEGEFYKQIANCRDGLILVGPSIEEIERSAHGDLIQKDEYIDRVLQRLCDLNFKRLRATYQTKYLHHTKRHNLTNCLVTPVDQFNDEHSLSHELYRIRELSCNPGLIDCWSPGVLNSSSQTWLEKSATDFHLLRILAIGSLVLEKVPLIRASSVHFSLDTIHLAAHLGANDLGFGAFDQLTQETLRLQPLGDLKRISRIN